MSNKFKLIKADSKHFDMVEKEIKEYVNKSYINGEYAPCSEIHSVFRKDLGLSATKLDNILKDLVNRGEISTYYENGRRYYGPKKIPLSIKIGFIMSTGFALFWFILDLTSNDIVRNYILLGSNINEYKPEITNTSTLPFLILSLVIVVFMTFIWYVSDKYYSSIKK